MHYFYNQEGKKLFLKGDKRLCQYGEMLVIQRRKKNRSTSTRPWRETPGGSEGFHSRIQSYINVCTVKRKTTRAVISQIRVKIKYQ